MNMLSKKAKLGLLSIVVLGGGMLATGQAVAMCGYNHTSSTPLKFHIKFGDSINADPGDSGCIAGKGGETTVFKVINNWPDKNICSLTVADHGWIKVYDHETDKYKAVAYNTENYVMDTCYGP